MEQDEYSKGDDDAPNYRGRIVARDIRKKGKDSIFAPTLPLEALRTVVGFVATKECWSEPGGKELKRVRNGFRYPW